MITFNWARQAAATFSSSMPSIILELEPSCTPPISPTRYKNTFATSAAPALTCDKQITIANMIS